MMLVSHISDNHGSFYERITHKCIDAIIHSGDLLPDPPLNKGSLHANIERWQQQWVREHMQEFKEWIGDKPFLFIQGNHCHPEGDWLEGELKLNGINAICLHDKITHFEGLEFYGLPYITWCNGYHANELNDDQMQVKIDEMVKSINEATYVDVLVCHQPPMKILDKDLRNHLHWGNQRMTDALFEQIDEDKVPRHVLMGHCHSANGIRLVSKNNRTVLFSNAATTQHILECGE